MVAWKDAHITPPFMINHAWPATRNPVIDLPPLNNQALTTDPLKICQGSEKFHTNKLTGT